MNPRIEIFPETKLLGMRTSMSFANNKTKELWQDFMPRRKEIRNPVNTNLYSVELYHDTAFFIHFDPAKEFEKWAAIEVDGFDSIPGNMYALVIPESEYAVFNYKGRPSEARGTYQFIYSKWIPNSGYTLDNRPHFALMGEKYKGESPDSEEELWIPIRTK
ncbi:MAG TPA: GyrI-like domain-containing protein [Ohtaekwangia sp.]|nr:GyrI-like domain-containing protein [Ohtaekwangia sp.]